MGYAAQDKRSSYRESADSIFMRNKPKGWQKPLIERPKLRFWDDEEARRMRAAPIRRPR